MTGPPTTMPQPRERRLRAEVLIVLGLSLGQSAVYAIVSLVAKLTAGPLREQTSTLNASRSPRRYLDLTYQLLDIGFSLLLVALALHLLAVTPGRVGRLLGLDYTRPGRDLVYGAGLAALIGLPGIAIYFLGRELGVTTTVVASALNEHWWTVPVLVLAAVENAVLEEVLVVGYLMTRLRELGWSTMAIIATSAALRGCYHLYQGIGPGIANAAMGALFGWWFHRTGRVLPLVVAHALIDIVAFVGYASFKDALGLP